MQDGVFGDTLTAKDDSTLRLALLNVDSIPEHGWSHKRKLILNWWQ